MRNAQIKRDYGTAITPGPFFTSPVETITDREGTERRRGPCRSPAQPVTSAFPGNQPGRY